MDRLGVFKYGVFVFHRSGGTTGGSKRRYMALEPFQNADLPYMAFLFGHEFGHTLDLDHSPHDQANSFWFSPNYNSIMCYRWGRVDTDYDCLPDGVYDYSHGERLNLYEAWVGEGRGLGGPNLGAIDWNGNGRIDEDAYSFHLNVTDVDTTGFGGPLNVWVDQDDWSEIDYSKIGGFGPGIVPPGGISSSEVEETDCSGLFEVWQSLFEE